MNTVKRIADYHADISHYRLDFIIESAPYLKSIANPNRRQSFSSGRATKLDDDVLARMTQ